MNSYKLVLNTGSFCVPQYLSIYVQSTRYHAVYCIFHITLYITVLYHVNTSLILHVALMDCILEPQYCMLICNVSTPSLHASFVGSMRYSVVPCYLDNWQHLSNATEAFM